MEFYNTDNEDFRKIAKHEIINPMVKIELLDSHENAYAELIGGYKCRANRHYIRKL